MDCNWIVPAPRDVLRVLTKLESDKAKGTVVLPLWQSAPFWPVLQPSENCFTHFVKEFRLLPQLNVIVPGNGNNGIFSKIPLPFKLMAVKIDCTTR